MAISSFLVLLFKFFPYCCLFPSYFLTLFLPQLLPSIKFSANKSNSNCSFPTYPLKFTTILFSSTFCAKNDLNKVVKYLHAKLNVLLNIHHLTWNTKQYFASLFIREKNKQVFSVQISQDCLSYNTCDSKLHMGHTPVKSSIGN